MPAPHDTTTNTLASLIVLLQKLYEQLTTDRQQWAGTGKDMAASIATLETHIQTFRGLQPEFKAHIITLMKDESQHAAHTVTTAVQNSLTPIITQNLKPILQPLAQATDAAQRQLTYQHQLLQHSTWWLILGILVSSIVTGLIMRYGLQPEFSDADRQVLQQGYALQTARQNPDWYERDRILEPYLGKRLVPSSSPPQLEPNKKSKALPKA